MGLRKYDFMIFPGLNLVFLCAGTYISSLVLGFRARGFALVGLDSKTPKFLTSILT